MEAKAGKLKADLESAAESLNEKYGVGITEGFTEKFLGRTHGSAEPIEAGKRIASGDQSGPQTALASVACV